MHATHDHVIVTVGLTKVFRDFWLREKVSAVADLDLQIEPGEV
ncbi:MAG TPA: ABC transporter ATP-binding protein, partial [Phycisphaerae bacterium]|nr:ABC transporter ATP-binding protein [Phycisphaerae bacterium]